MQDIESYKEENGMRFLLKVLAALSQIPGENIFSGRYHDYGNERFLSFIKSNGEPEIVKIDASRDNR